MSAGSVGLLFDPHPEIVTRAGQLARDFAGGEATYEDRRFGFVCEMIMAEFLGQPWTEGRFDPADPQKPDVGDRFEIKSSANPRARLMLIATAVKPDVDYCFLRPSASYPGTIKLVGWLPGAMILRFPHWYGRHRKMTRAREQWAVPTEALWPPVTLAAL